ncbi:MAG: FAD-dependent oxidoreductase [Candidatus Bathyarchaeia archaeon]|jgi:succinate dehydrogenase/fumarate reductase flavoprotein subunit
MSSGSVIKADVLVIGGGGAGARAAIEADERGAHVLMVTKGHFGGSESSATSFAVSHAGGYQAAFGHADPMDNPAVHFSDIVQAGLGMCDKRLARIVAYEAPRRLLDLEKWGARFEKSDGKYAQRLGCFSSRPRMCETKNHGNSILSVLKKEIERRDIEVMENVMITNLLTQNNACAGATGISKKGDFIVFIAKSTILATGGAGMLYRLNFDPPSITGDGYAIAFRAGVELVNMEFLQIGMGIVRSDETRPLLFTNQVWPLRPRVYNVDGESFLEKYMPRDVNLNRCLSLRALHWPFSTSDESKYIDIAMFNEIKEGRGTRNGGVYVDLRNIAESKMRERHQLWLEWLRTRGIDPMTDLLEVALFAHAFNGGIRINEKAETTLPGLYAAGEVTGGMHGADRLGGNMLANCQVFGARAGEFAAKRALTINDQITADGSEEYERLARIREAKAGIDVTKTEKAIQEVMWRNVLVVRNERGLNECKMELERIMKHHLLDLCIQNEGELVHALEIRNMLDVGQILTTAALLRRESRGSHYRDDYPSRDDQDQMKSIIIRQEGEEIKAYSSLLE